MMKSVVVAISGASGSIYAERLIDELLPKVDRLFLLMTDTGRAVVIHELSGIEYPSSGLLLRALRGNLSDQEKNVVKMLSNQDLFSSIASGSSAPDAMVVIPASMGIVARIATGLSSNLIERAADVVMKENKRLIIVPRESPLSAIHLENLLKLSRLGVRVVPAMPGFYHRPNSLMDLVNFSVARVMEQLDMEQTIVKSWNGVVK